MNKPVIVVEGLALSCDQQPVLDLLSFRLAAGERCLIRGPNGCGKSTFLRLLMGFLRPAAGSIEVLGARAGSPGWASTAGRIGYCGQEVARTDLPLSVREVVDFGTIPRRLGHGDRARAVSAALESVGAGALARRLYRGLSAGERQRPRTEDGRPGLGHVHEYRIGVEPEVGECLRPVIGADEVVDERGAVPAMAFAVVLRLRAALSDGATNPHFSLVPDPVVSARIAAS